VARLINAELSTTREVELRQHSPTHVLHLTARDVFRLHFGHERVYVVAHQVKLMLVVLFGRMHGDFRRRQPKDEPALTNVDLG
jgi:hypothetical protein